MIITVYYEDKNHPVTLEVPDADCEIWVETDYQQRLATAEDKSTVTRRSPQEIMDEECNKPTFNSHQRETRRHCSYDALDPEGQKLVGADDVDIGLPPDEFEELYRAIDQLKPCQREMLTKIFWEGMKQVDIARSDGVGESAVSQRMSVIISKLRKILDKEILQKT